MKIIKKFILRDRLKHVNFQTELVDESSSPSELLTFNLFSLLAMSIQSKVILDMLDMLSYREFIK